MKVVSTSKKVLSETKKTITARNFKPRILLLGHRIWWEVKLEAIQMRVIGMQFPDGKTVKNAIKNAYKQNNKITTDEQWAERKKFILLWKWNYLLKIIWSKQKVGKVFLVKQQTNLVKT